MNRALRASLLVLLLAACAGCGSTVAVQRGPSPLCPTALPAVTGDRFQREVSLVSLPSGVRYADIRQGCGPLAVPGQAVTIQYSAWLADGREFDTSRQAGRTGYTFQPGSRGTLPGFAYGFRDMRVGGVRRLVIPSSLAFGSQGVAPVIPPNATIVVDMELVKVAYPPPAPGQ